MVAMPWDILHKVAVQLNLTAMLALGCTCRRVMESMRHVCKERVKHQTDEVIERFPSHIRSSIPLRVWLDVDWIEFDPKWLRPSGFRIPRRQIVGHPFKCCYDTFGRLALVMRRAEDVAVLFELCGGEWAFASRLFNYPARLSESMVARLALALAYKYAV